MHCNQCGSKAPEGGRFCENCGSALQGIRSSSAPAQPAGSAPPPQYAVPASSAAPAYPPQPPPQQPQPYYGHQAPGEPRRISHRDEVVSFGSWMGMFFLTMIPLVNMVLILIWAFSGDVNRNKQNYWRAAIVFSLIITAVTTLVFLVLGAFGMLMSV